MEENPLDDIAKLSERTGVMVGGIWLPEERLQEIMDELKESHTPTFIERIWPFTLIALGLFLIIRRLI